MFQTESEFHNLEYIFQSAYYIQICFLYIHKQTKKRDRYLNRAAQNGTITQLSFFFSEVRKKGVG